MQEASQEKKRLDAGIPSSIGVPYVFLFLLVSPDDGA
jgi:hypothetical protein